MLAIYIKNHLKMIFRKKSVIALMIVFPLLLIAALSSVFGDFMERDLTLNNVTVGYVIEGDTIFDLTPLEKIFNDNQILLEKMHKEEKDVRLKEGKIVAFIEIKEDGYTIYRTSEFPIEVAVVENICYSFFQQIRTPITNTAEVRIKTQVLDIAPLPSAVDYYGIIEIVYSVWLGAISLTSILSSERKNHILSRVQITTISKWKMYLAKFIPSVGICFMEMLVAMLLSYLLFGVQWGNILGSILIVFLSIVASIAFSLLVFTLCKQLFMGIIIIFVSGFAMGFLGGSFEIYMFSPYPESLKILSPIYHINRVLVEFSTSGSSNHTNLCVCLLIAICLLCTGITIWVMQRKEVLL